ncbi:MAG: histidine phosphatase family protein [Pseudomonadota bacterium]
MRRRENRAFLFACLFLAFTKTPATSQTSDPFAALNRPATVAIMRHALAPGTSDPSGFQLRDCTTQRNLDARGRAQARAIGAAIRAAGVRIDRVLSSQWCRCLETAELLGLGPVDEAPMLNSFFEDRSTAEAQTAELRAYLQTLPPDQTVLLVTHQVNITALTDRGVGSGEVFVIASGEDAGAVMDEILIAP